jgi:hypothetical protein
LPPPEPEDIYHVQELIDEIGGNDDLLEAYKQQWQFIRTQYHNRGGRKWSKRKSYVIRETNPTAKFIGNILRLIHQEQSVAYKFDFQLSFIMRHIDSNEVRLFYHGENTRFYDTPPLVENQQQLDQQIQYIDASDLIESAVLQRYDSKWRLEKIAGFAVTVYQIRGRLLGAKGVVLPRFIKKIKSIVTLVKDIGTNQPFNDNLCLLRAISLAKLMTVKPQVNIRRLLERLARPTMENFTRWLEYVNSPIEQRPVPAFPGIPLDQFENVEQLFNVNLWVYELVEEERKTRVQRRRRNNTDYFIDTEAAEVGEESDGEELEEVQVMRRKQKVQTAILIRAPTAKSQKIDGRLKVYLNRYQNHLSLITNINQYGQCLKCKCGRRFNRAVDLERHKQTCTGEKEQKLIYPGTGMAAQKSIWEQLDQLGISTTGPRHYPYFACWDFEARNCASQDTLFTPFPSTSQQLPLQDPHEAPPNFPRYDQVRTRYIEGDKYVIRAPQLDKLEEYCQLIASQQPCIFGIQATILYHLTKDAPSKLRRRMIIASTNTIHNLQEFQEHFPARRILASIENQQLLSPQVFIDAIEFKVARKQLLFTSILKPISFAVNSNVPGHDAPHYDVCEYDDEDSIQRLIASFITKLNTISDEAYSILRRKHETSFDKLRERIDHHARAAASIGDLHPLLKSKKTLGDPAVPQKDRQEYLYHKSSSSQYSFLYKQAEKWCRLLPALGFNSASFDVNLIREYLLPQLLTAHEEDQAPGEKLEKISCIKKNNSYMSLTTKRLQFLDMMYYLAAGSSYESFVKAYAPQTKQVKCPFPYKWLDSVERLMQGLPARRDFYNDLKNKELTQDDYEAVQQLWIDNNFTNMAQYLKFYNELDVTGFVAAVEAYKSWWTKQNIDPFKQGISLPGLALRHLLKDLPPHTILCNENEKNKDLHAIARRNITGGPSIINTRHHMRGETKIRDTNKKCKSVIGLDCNSLYLYTFLGQQPNGLGARWDKDRTTGQLVRKDLHKKWQHAEYEWLSWLEHQHGMKIQHNFNGGQVKLGSFSVDGLGVCPSSGKLTAYEMDGCWTHGHKNCHYIANCDPDLMMERQQRTKFRKELLERDYNVKMETMQRCHWDRLKRRRDVREFLEQNIWLPLKFVRNITETELVQLIRKEKVFGFVQCDVRTPDELKEEFADMPPIFKNIDISIDDIGETMKQFAQETGQLQQPRRSLISSYHATQQLFSSNLLKWYLDHGLEVSNVTLFVQFRGDKIFEHLPEIVARARLDADLAKNPDGTKDFAKVLVGEMMKLVGNRCVNLQLVLIIIFLEFYSCYVGTCVIWNYNLLTFFF